MAGVLIEKSIAQGLVELYHAWKSGKLFRLLAAAVRGDRVDRLVGKTKTELTAGGTCTVTVYTGTPGSEADSGKEIENVRCRLLNSGSIPADTWVKIEITNGHWDIYAYDCG